MTNDILVQWKIRGVLIRDGIAKRRVAGDQDLCDQKEATKLESCGFVDVLGIAASKTAVKRIKRTKNKKEMPVKDTRGGKKAGIK